MTPALSRRCSNQLSYRPLFPGVRPIEVGGGTGIRTPDIQLAKLALYQLSYTPSRGGLKKKRTKAKLCAADFPKHVDFDFSQGASTHLLVPFLVLADPVPGIDLSQRLVRACNFSIERR